MSRAAQASGAPARAAEQQTSSLPTWLPKYFTSSTCNFPVEVGTYRAFHLTPGNRAVHWVTTITTELAVLVLFASFPLLQLGTVYNPTGALALLLPLLYVYYRMSPRVFQLMLLWFSGLYFVANYLYAQLAFFPLLPMAAANLAGGAFACQVFLGHRVFEGHDNFANASQVVVSFCYFGPLFEGAMMLPLLGRAAAKRMQLQSKTVALGVLSRKEWHKAPPNKRIEVFISAEI